MQEAFTVVIAFVSILVVTILFFLRQKKKPSTNNKPKEKEVPGPKPSDPVLGNLGDLKKAKGVHFYLSMLHKEYGNVISFWWGNQKVVSICSPEAYRDTSKLFDRPALFFEPFCPMIGKKSIQITNGAEGKERITGYIKQPFSAESVYQTIWPTFINLIEGTIDRWLASKEPVKLHEECINTSLMGILSSSMGIPTDNVEKALSIQHAYNVCWNEMNNRLEGSAPDENRKKEFDENLAIVHGLVDDIIEKKKEGKDTKNYPFIDALITHGKDIEVIRSDVVTFIIGGFHTTGNALCWMFYYLCKYPEIQEKVRKEVDSVWNHEGPLTPQDVSALKYTKQVVNETLRIISLPFAARYFNEDSLVGGYKIEKNTPIIQALSVTMTSDQFWDNPDQFNPSRFDKDIKNLLFVPFGFSGRRTCPGQTYSMSMLTLSAAMILSKCILSLAPGQSDPVTVIALVSRPKDEIYVNVTERKKGLSDPN